MTPVAHPIPDRFETDMSLIRTARKRNPERPSPPVRPTEPFCGPFTLLREYGPDRPTADRRYPALTSADGSPSSTVLFDAADGTPVEFAASGLRLDQHYGGRMAELVVRPEAAVALAITESRTTISCHAHHVHPTTQARAGARRRRRFASRSARRNTPPQQQLVAGQIRHEWLSTVSVIRLSGCDIGTSELVFGVRSAESELRLGVRLTSSEADNIARCVIRLATESCIAGRGRLTTIEIEQIHQQTARMVRLGGTVALPASRTVPG